MGNAPLFVLGWEGRDTVRSLGQIQSSSQSLYPEKPFVSNPTHRLPNLSPDNEDDQAAETSPTEGYGTRIL